MWSWRASTAQLPETTGACSSQRALKCRTGKLGWRWVTLHYTSSCGIHFNVEKEECLGVRHLFSLNFLYRFKWIPWRRWGLREKSMRPCHSTLTAWTGSFPKQIQQKAAEEEAASPVTSSWGFYAATAEESHRGGRKPGRFPQIPQDSQEAGIVLRRYSPLIETSPCPPPPLWPSCQGIADRREHLSNNRHGSGRTRFSRSAVPGCQGRVPAPFLCMHPRSMKTHVGSMEHAADWSCPCFTTYQTQTKGQISAGWPRESEPDPRHFLSLPSMNAWPWGRPRWRKQSCIPRSAAHPTGCVPSWCSLLGGWILSVPFEWLCGCVPTKFSLPQLLFSCCPVYICTPMSVLLHTNTHCFRLLLSPSSLGVPPRGDSVPAHSDLNPGYPHQHTG